MTCLVIFGWVVNQRYFKEMTDRKLEQKCIENKRN